jgi:hypothetical protein
LQCGYEAVQPRKRRRTSFAGSALSQGGSINSGYSQWAGKCDPDREAYDNGLIDVEMINKWDSGSTYQYQESEVATVDWDAPVEGDDVEEVISTEPHTSTPTTLVRPRSQYPDLAMIAPSPTTSPLLEFSVPIFQEFTARRNRRSLVDHFCNVLSHLIVFKEDTGNPFRQLILPLSHSSSQASPVLNAILALSSAHLECRGIENEEKSLDFHNRALQGLAMLIEQNEMDKREEMLGAIILLVYYEVLVQRGNSSIVNGHLKGAMTIMKSRNQIATPAMRFLEHVSFLSCLRILESDIVQAFRFYDVITALSLGTSPNSNPETAPSYFPLPLAPEAEMEQSPLDSVDTLLGLSTDLWPIIHRLSQVPSIKASLDLAVAAGQSSKAIVLRTEIENSSQAIELALTNWQPSLSHIQSLECNSIGLVESNPNSIQNIRLQSILHNADAYRHSAIVFLYRTIHVQPRQHFMVQNHTHTSLQACFNVVQLAEKCYNGPMSALLWPLFVASCEAMTEEDRGLAANSFSGAQRRQGMNNIMQAWEIVQEVWSRYDGGEQVVEWRDICKEKGMNIVFG